MSDPTRQHLLGLVVLLGLASMFVGISAAHYDQWIAVHITVWVSVMFLVWLLVRGIR